MDLRSQLQVAHRRIAELEKELDGYRKADRAQPSGRTSNSSPPSATFKSSVITRAAAAALKHSGKPVVDLSPARRAKNLSPKKPSISAATAVPLQPKPSSAGDANESLESITLNNVSVSPTPTPKQADLSFSRSKQPAPKPLRPASCAMNQRFSGGPSTAVPLKPKLSIDKSKRSSMHAGSKLAPSVLSPVSTFSEHASAGAQPSATGAPKRGPKAAGGAKKERASVVAKITEPRAGQTRYWTQEEHERFLEAVAQYGEKAYVAISNFVESRTPKQVRTHAQKFQMKMARLARQSAENGETLELPPGMLPINLDAVGDLAGSRRACAPPAGGGGGCSDDSSGQTGGATAGGDVRTMVPDGPEKSMEDLVAEASSSVSDVSGDTLSDPYLSYIGGDAEGDAEDVLQDCFAAKLPKTFQPRDAEMEAKTEALALAEEDGAMKTQDDELEDLGELPMASLCNFGIV